jgi:hypothetical protein
LDNDEQTNQEVQPGAPGSMNQPEETNPSISQQGGEELGEVPESGIEQKKM